MGSGWQPAIFAPAAVSMPWVTCRGQSCFRHGEHALEVAAWRQARPRSIICVTYRTRLTCGSRQVAGRPMSPFVLDKGRSDMLVKLARHAPVRRWLPQPRSRPPTLRFAGMTSQSLADRVLTLMFGLLAAVVAAYVAVAPTGYLHKFLYLSIVLAFALTLRPELFVACSMLAFAVSSVTDAPLLAALPGPIYFPDFVVLLVAARGALPRYRAPSKVLSRVCPHCSSRSGH